MQTLLVQHPYPDRIVTLRARTWFVDGPGVRERRVLADAGEFEAVLRDEFGIDTSALGSDRVDRLWRSAVAQHEAHREAEAPARDPA